MQSTQYALIHFLYFIFMHVSGRILIKPFICESSGSATERKTLEDQNLNVESGDCVCVDDLLLQILFNSRGFTGIQNRC